MLVRSSFRICSGYLGDHLVTRTASWFSYVAEVQILNVAIDGLLSFDERSPIGGDTFECFPHSQVLGQKAAGKAEAVKKAVKGGTAEATSAA
jgi:hypothetical protein